MSTEAGSRLRRAMQRGATQLGIGPMSVACVDAAIDLANEEQIPLMLVASRRQVECAEQGGGYVNRWTTEAFADYVRRHDRGGYILLCRDHGGPWQNEGEVRRGLVGRDAMAEAKKSLLADLEAGFDLLHLDPSVPPPTPNEAHDPQAMLLELFDFVNTEAARRAKPVLIEVGTEEQDGGLNTTEDLGRFLASLSAECRRRAFDMPLFVVAQTGTLVQETRNVGLFAGELEKDEHAAALAQVGSLVKAARTFGVAIKEHNGDYLSDAIRATRPALGVGAVNIAPEFGVAETRYLLSLCNSLGLVREEERFLQLAFDSGKWKKWMMTGSTATDRDRAVIAGHYIFATDAFAEVFARMAATCKTHGIDLAVGTRNHLKESMRSIAKAFLLC